MTADVSPTIHERAMLVSLSIKSWSARKQDDRASEEVAEAHGAERNAGSYTKALVAREALEKIKKIISDARVFHYGRTLPWSDEGLRILPSEMFFEYDERIKEFREAFNLAAAEFAANYPQYTEEAKARLGTLWKAEDYLEPAMVAGKFSFECNIYPLPESRDFRVDLGTQETERIREQIKENVNQAAEEAVRAILERARECVGRMAERLGSYDPESPGKAPFRDTMITNMRDFAELLPRLNFTGSPDIEILAKDIAHLARFDPDRLRNNRAAQVQAKHEADKIMQRMEGYG